ncbi:MAG: hypothetical protein Q9197_005106 [Variospora fuerteventurae]
MLRPRCTLALQGGRSDDVNSPSDGGRPNGKGTSDSDGEAKQQAIKTPFHRFHAVSPPAQVRQDQAFQGVHVMVCGESNSIARPALMPRLLLSQHKKKASPGPPVDMCGYGLQEHIDSLSWAGNAFATCRRLSPQRPERIRHMLAMQATPITYSNGSTGCYSGQLWLHISCTKHGLDSAARMTAFGHGTPSLQPRLVKIVPNVVPDSDGAW